MLPRLPHLAGVTVACALALAGCRNEPPHLQGRLAGLVTDKALDEISGMAASQRSGQYLWLLDDDASPARLYSISLRGNRQGSADILGVTTRDWEDLASFTLDGKPYLLIADTGDNGGLRKTLQLHIIPEPENPAADTAVKPAWSITFRWPDGPRDCEAVMVDPLGKQILLISKKRQPPQLFTLPLRPTAQSPRILTAKLAGTLAGVPQASARERRDNPTYARLRSQVTAADLAPQRDAIAVLTYDNLLVYRRRPEQNWAQALASSPSVRPLGLLLQAEAVAWSRDGSGIYASGEFHPAPLYYWPYRR